MRVPQDCALSAYDKTSRHTIKFSKPSLTRQDQAEAADINVIYAKTQRGEIVQAATRRPEFGDFSNVVTYDQALTQILDAEQAFFDLPAHVRREYDDDPKVYYEEVMAELEGKAKEEFEKKKAAAEKEKFDAELAAARELAAKHPEKETKSKDE